MKGMRSRYAPGQCPECHATFGEMREFVTIANLALGWGADLALDTPDQITVCRDWLACINRCRARANCPPFTEEQHAENGRVLKEYYGTDWGWRDALRGDYRETEGAHA